MSMKTKAVAIASDQIAPAIRVQHMTKFYGDVEVLRGIDLEVQPGEVISVIGPSGSGKSTLIRCLNLLEEPTSGTVEVIGKRLFEGDRVTVSKRELQRFRARAGMVFQSFNLFPNL